MSKEDAQALRKAMKGWGTNEKKLIEILGDKTNDYLVDLDAMYTKVVERDLKKDIKSETGGHFEDLLIGLITPRADYDAQLVYKAIKGLGTNESLLSEVFGTRCRAEIQLINKAFTRIFEKDMITMVEEDVGGNYEKLLNLLIIGSVDHSDEDVDKHITALYEAGEKKLGTNEGVFIRIIGGHDRDYNEKLYWAYAKKYDKALDAVIKSEFRGAVETLLVYLVTPLDILFSELLLKAMKGMGTNDTDLIRYVVTQKDKDLVAIGDRFLRENKKTLKAYVASECSGDYAKLFQAVLTKFSQK